MKDGTSILMIVVLYASLGIGYTIDGVHGMLGGLTITLGVGFILGIGFLGLIIQNHRGKGN